MTAAKKTARTAAAAPPAAGRKALVAVAGGDSGTRERLIARVRRDFLGTDGPDPGLVTFGPPDPARPSSMPSLGAILDEARTPSLFSPRKLVLVRGADALLASSSSTAREAALSSLLEFARQAPSDACLVLDFDKLDQRTAPAKALEKAGCLLAAPRLYAARFQDADVSMASTLGAHLTELARERGLRLSDQAGRLLLELSREQTAYLAAELNKLSDYLGEERRDVTAADVELLAAPGAFGAADAVVKAMAGQVDAALKAAERLFASGMDNFGRMVWDESAIALALISAAFRKLQDAEASAAGGGRQAGKRPARETAALAAAVRRFGRGGFDRAFRMLRDAELEIKTGGGRGPRTVAVELLIGLSGGGGGR